METKELLKSIALTFLAGFALIVAPALGDMTLADVQTGALAGVLFAGVRTGMKMVLELFLMWYSQK